MIRSYAEIWADALLLPGEHDLQRSIRVEPGNLVSSDDLPDIERKCRSALHDMREQWNAEVKKGAVIETLNYYDKSAHYAYELMWWHSLVHDQSPLAYVVALHLALQNGFKDSLDFGSGVGSGGCFFLSMASALAWETSAQRYSIFRGGACRHAEFPPPTSI